MRKTVYRHLMPWQLLAAMAMIVVLIFALHQEDAAAQPSPPQPDAISQLLADTEGEAQISLNSATGVASFIRLPASREYPLPTKPASSPEAAANAFLNRYGAAFGISDVQSELILEDKDINAITGGTQLTFQQVYEDLPVFAAVIKARVGQGRQITSINGTFLPGISLPSTIPALSAEEAAQIAVSAVAVQNTSASQKRSSGDVQVSEQGQPAAGDLVAIRVDLTVFRTGFLQGIPGSDHLAYEVEVANKAVSIREFVFVDANKGGVIAQFSGINHNLYRELSEGALNNVIWEEGDVDPLPANWAGGSAAKIAGWQNEIDGAKETYNLFATLAGWDSYDDAGATMRTVNIAGSNCPNAYWNGISANFCPDVTGDDTVAHEWGHAYTENSSNLIYWWQSGALSESYSDIWGETVDLLNGRGSDEPDVTRIGATCSSNVAGANFPGNPTIDTLRWLAGEDNPGFDDEPQGSGNALRDMWEPTCFGDPGKVSDREYRCGDEDNGGVHSNSGVPNHAFALLVDGGSYNGQDIRGLGLTKTAHIHWGAQMMLTPASNFSDHADALEVSCKSLIDVDLPTLSTDVADSGLSGEVISIADCQEVAKAVAAVELRTAADQCHFDPLLDPDAPALCAGSGDVQQIFFEDWEAGTLPAGWSFGTRALGNPLTFDNPDWQVVGNLPLGANGTYAAFVPNEPAGNCIDDDKTGVLYLDSPPIEVPVGILPRVAFDHWVATEFGWDGGNLKISVNDGPWTLVSASRFEFNTYIDYVYTFGNQNPLAGQAAFTGADGGENFGSWGQSQVNLGGLATAGDFVRFRFEMGIDKCGGAVGWYIDDIEMYACSNENNQPPENDDFDSPVTISAAPFEHRVGIRAATTAVDDPTLPCGPNNQGRGTVWYKLVSDQDVRLTADTIGSGYDTILVVWEGARGALQEVACNDDTVGWQSQLEDVELNGGTTYYIEVAAYDGDMGTLELNVAISPPDNDDYDHAREISTLPNKNSQSVQWASTAEDDPVLPCGPGHQGFGSIWYEITPEENIQLAADTFGSAYDTVLVVWEGVRGDLTEVACNDDSAGLQSRILGVTLEGGVTYTIEIAGFSDNLGLMSLTIDSLTAPDNDDFDQATEITTSPFDDLQNVAGATTARDDPLLPCGPFSQGKGSVWYELTPQESSLLTADTFGSSYDTVLAIWQGSRGKLTAVACNDDRIGGQSELKDVPLARGRTYFIEVTSYNNTVADLELNVEFEAYVPVTHDLQLVSGWNMISSYVWPDVPELATLLKPIENDMILIKNGYGQVYWPELAINGIGDWNVRHGYQLYMENGKTLSITGYPIDPAKISITILNRWNLIAYVLDTPLDIAHSLAGIIDELVLVKNGAGEIYWPAFEINQIGTMQPGEGYQVNVRNETELSYPDS